MATLYIIGNGFDLYHEIQSSYKNFHDYAWAHAGSKGYWLGLLEECYPKVTDKGELELWCDLEKALGHIDFDMAFEVSTEDIEPEEEHEFRYQAQMEDAPEFILTDMFSAFHELFEEWVNQIDIDVEPVKIPHFDKNGKFLSFNYTETLEYLYDIPIHQINYIHGRRNANEELIVGHAQHLKGDDYLPYEPEIYKYQGYENIEKVVNNEKKNITDIIWQNQGYWKSLKDVDKIIIYGHSLSDIDFAYFREIVNNISPNSEWWFSVHYCNFEEKQDTINNVKTFIKKLGLNRNRCHAFQM